MKCRLFNSKDRWNNWAIWVQGEGSLGGGMFLASCCGTPAASWFTSLKTWAETDTEQDLNKSWGFSVCHSDAQNTQTHTRTAFTRLRGELGFLSAPTMQSGSQCCCTWKTVKLQTLALCSDTWYYAFYKYIYSVFSMFFFLSVHLFLPFSAPPTSEWRPSRSNREKECCHESFLWESRD